MSKHKLSAKRKKSLRVIIRENRLVLFGALAMLAWALWEGAVRLEAVDGITRAYFGLVKEGDIPLGRALENLWNTPEARHDLLSFVYLALIAVFSVFCLLLRKRWRAGLIMLPLCALVLTYQPATLPLLRALNLFELMKDASAIAVALGAATNIVSALAAHRRRRRSKKRRAAIQTARKRTQKSLPAQQETQSLPERPKKRRGDRFGSQRTRIPRRR